MSQGFSLDGDDDDDSEDNLLPTNLKFTAKVLGSSSNFSDKMKGKHHKKGQKQQKCHGESCGLLLSPRPVLLGKLFFPLSQSPVLIVRKDERVAGVLPSVWGGWGGSP